MNSPPENCCEWHWSTCEPPSELCCDSCSEVNHPYHRDGSLCVLPRPKTRTCKSCGYTDTATPCGVGAFSPTGEWRYWWTDEVCIRCPNPEADRG